MAEETRNNVRQSAPAGDDRVHRVPSRWSLVALTVALLASLTANGVLVKAAERYFATTSAVRLDPVGLDVYAKDRATPPAADRPVLVLFGDSRAAMWAPPDLPEYRLLNRGIGFQTTAQILLRVDEDVVSLHPAVVVLEAGVNDLKAIAEFPERRAEIVSRCEANLQRIVDRCRSTGATVVLVSVFRIGAVALWRRPFWSAEVDASVLEVNAFLRTLAGATTPLLDADPVLNDESGKIRPAFQLDHLHLVPPAYAALDDRLVEIVHGLRGSPPSPP
jgi:lysophospholipase L1-like esterase